MGDHPLPITLYCDIVELMNNYNEQGFKKRGGNFGDKPRASGRFHDKRSSSGRSGYGKQSRDHQPAQFGRRPMRQHDDLAGVKRKLEALEAKLDKVIEILQPSVPLGALLEKATSEEVETREE